MSCVLRAYGKNFDVDNYVKNTDIEFSQVYKKGEPKFPASQPEGKKKEYSGIGIEVSRADFNEFDSQLADAIDFLNRNIILVKELTQIKGVENVSLDFGVETKPPFWSSYTIPSELASITGELGINLCVSTYPCNDDDET